MLFHLMAISSDRHFVLRSILSGEDTFEDDLSDKPNPYGGNKSNDNLIIYELFVQIGIADLHLCFSNYMQS